MRDKKKIVIGVLCALVGIMAVGYAALATRLNITGTASIDSTWKVEITNITERDVVGDATSKETPSYTATTANFSVGLIQPGDSITYDIEISNLGTLKAKVDSIQVVVDENDAITYTTEGLAEGDKLGVGEKDTLSITVTYNSEITSQPAVTTKDITVAINYVQDLGTSNEPSIAYDYVIGDQINFAGSNWYVIKNSTSDEDYVTLLKEQVLTHSELGEYAITTSEGKKYDTMPYYWDNICHPDSYGYADWGWSGCEGHSDYAGSKVKEYLEGTYINTLGETNLKEVDGYKIRLITTQELENNGWAGNTTVCTGSCYEGYGIIKDNAPSWIYQNFGELSDYSNNLNGYWTMTSYQDGPYMWIVNRTGNLYRDDVHRDRHGVRPVINLLKSSI